MKHFCEIKIWPERKLLVLTLTAEFIIRSGNSAIFCNEKRIRSDMEYRIRLS